MLPLLRLQDHGTYPGSADRAGFVQNCIDKQKSQLGCNFMTIHASHPLNSLQISLFDFTPGVPVKLLL